MKPTNQPPGSRTGFALFPPLTSLVLLLLACLCSVSCPRSFGALLSHDSFAYPLNASLPGQNGGTGFSGAWVAGVNAGVPASRFQLFTPSLTYPGLASDGVRLRVTSGSAQGARRPLAQPIGADGTVRYVSLLVRPDATPSPSSYFGLQLLGNAGADLFAGKPGGGATTKYVLENAGGASQVATTRDVTANAVALLVLRLQFNAGNDLVSLYVNPVPGTPEPLVADAVKTDLNLGTTVVPALTGPAAWSADELRVGDTFDAVLPPGPDFQLRPIQSGSATEHNVVTRSVQTADPLPAGRTLAFELVGEAYGAQIDPVTGEFSWVPGELDGGQRRTFTIRATSNANPPASVTISFYLDVTEGNQPPQLAEIPDQSVTEGSEFTYPLVATDSDIPAQNISYSLTVKPDGLDVSTAGVLTWRPTISQAGFAYPVTVFAIDTMGGLSRRSFTVSVQPRTGFVARWTGTADGDWNNPANWDIGRVPNDNATEFFDVIWGLNPVTVRVTGDITVRSLSLRSGGTLDLQSPNGNFSIQNSLLWKNGVVSGQSRMTVQGRATLEGRSTDTLTLRDQCSLVLNEDSFLGSPLRCDGNVTVVVKPSAVLDVAMNGGFIRVNGVPELRNEGTLRIMGQEQPVPFIYLYNRGIVTTFESTIDFQTGAGLDMIQEASGNLTLGAGLGHGATLNGNALFRQGGSVSGQGYIREARVEGRIQGHLNFNRLSFGSTATTRFSLIGSRELISAAQPIALDGQLELTAFQGVIPGPDTVLQLVHSDGEITGLFTGRPFGQRVLIPGGNETMLLTRSADSHLVELRKFLPQATTIFDQPLSFRLSNVGAIGGCFVVPHPAVNLPEGIAAGGTLTVKISDDYDAAVDQLVFRPNPAFPEADEVVFEGPAGGEQTVRFRGLEFGKLQLTGPDMTCTLNDQADSEAAVALLGRLRYENTELTADWFTSPDMIYPQRTIVVTLTDANGANAVSRAVDFPVLWGLRLPESVELVTGEEETLHLQGWFSNGQELPMPNLPAKWSDSACGVLQGNDPDTASPGPRRVKGLSPRYCCSVTAQAGEMLASTSVYAGGPVLVTKDEIYGVGSPNPPTLLQLALQVVLGFFRTIPYEEAVEAIVERCPTFALAFYRNPDPCETTPAARTSLHASGNPLPHAPAPMIFYSLETLMQETVAGRRWANLYRQHGGEVVRLFLRDASLLAKGRELLAAYSPGIAALLAGRGDTVPIYAPMITQVNDFWNALAEHASPALKTVLQQEQARFDNFRLFKDRTFSEWAGLLGIRVPFQPYLHISLMKREATKFNLGLNDVPGVDLYLWRSVDLQTWTQVTNAEIQRDGTTLIFTDPAPPVGQAFYSVRQ